jgi:hypothetical protein
MENLDFFLSFGDFLSGISCNFKIFQGFMVRENFNLSCEKSLQNDFFSAIEKLNVGQKADHLELALSLYLCLPEDMRLRLLSSRMNRDFVLTTLKRLLGSGPKGKAGQA